MERPQSTIERLEQAADAPTGVRFVGASVMPAGEPQFVPWRQLHDEARAVGAALQARGLGPGDHVAILGPTSRGLITIIRGCWVAGIASMVLPLPMRMGSLEAFVESTRARIRHGDAKLVLIDDQLAAFYEPAPGDPPIAPMGSVLPGATGVPSGERLEAPAPDPERLVILQYTSGSTSEPKGVMIPDRVLSANVDACCEGGGIVPEQEVLVSWLPLYHDMGLVGCLAIPMTRGANLVQAAPQDFLAHPGNWMQWISDRRGTATAGPNFSWVLATRALKRMRGLDLSPLTLALSGAEPIDPAAVEAFVAAAEPFGFTAGGVFPAFGMAEVAIGGSFSPRGRGLVCDTVDRVVLERDRVAKAVEISDPDDLALAARRLPLLGRPVPGLEMRIVDPDTFEERPERHVGELLIRGTSVTPGYYKRPDATAELFHDDWLCTGDLGYLLDGELVLCGRIKDVIIVGGRNVFPEDIERAIGVLDGVRAGNVIAFGMDGYKGKESVVVVAETRGGDLATIREAIHHRTLQVCGLPPRDVLLVQPSTLPKTSSGKLQRAKCRELYLEETLELAHVLMRVFASDRHRLHDPEHEIESSGFQPPFEHPGRAEIIRAELAADEAFEINEPEPAGTAAIEAVHDPGLVRFLASAWEDYQREVRPVHDVVPDVFSLPGLRAGMGAMAEPSTVAARLGWWCFETTTPLTAGTYEAARSAVDCALAAAGAVLDGDRVAYGLCRPPGHHATTSLYGGYCFFNNAAVAAAHIAATTGSRVAVLDVDYHHGNGTQQIFYERADVTFVSLHGDPVRAYPYHTGHADETGAGRGSGSNRNIPLAAGTDDDAYLAALDRALAAVDAVDPAAVVVSLGVDTYVGDPMCDLALTTEGFARCGAAVAALGRPLVVLQEGGYADAALGANVRSWLRGALNSSV